MVLFYVNGDKKQSKLLFLFYNNGYSQFNRPVT